MREGGEAMIENERYARRREPHSSPETMGTRCDNCPHLSCIERPAAKVHRWHYYCQQLRRDMEFKELYAITEEECPEHREIRRGRR